MPAKIPKEKVRQDIQRVAEELGKVPTRQEYRDHGEYADITAREKFGSWSEAREAAGLEGGPTKNTYTPDEDILDDLRRVAGKIGESPSQGQYNEHGEYSHTLAYERFDGWNAALERAGLGTERDDRIPDGKLLEDIRQVAEVAGAPPSLSEYVEHGQHGRSVVFRRFGKWKEAVRRAGFEPNTVGPGTGEENPAWRGGYEPYYGENWYAQRRAARDRDGYQCRDCGMTDEEHQEKFGWELEVHHIKPVRTFDVPEAANDLANLITLCRTHHRSYEYLPNERAKELLG